MRTIRMQPFWNRSFFPPNQTESCCETFGFLFCHAKLNLRHLGFGIYLFILFDSRFSTAWNAMRHISWLNSWRVHGCRKARTCGCRVSRIGSFISLPSMLIFIRLVLGRPRANIRLSDRFSFFFFRVPPREHNCCSGRYVLQGNPRGGPVPM